MQLNDSKLTDYGHRTLLKAHSLSKLRGVLDLQHNPLPLQENLIRTAARDEKYEMKITRRGIKRELKPMPWRTSDRDHMLKMMEKIDRYVKEQERISVEEFKELADQIADLE